MKKMVLSSKFFICCGIVLLTILICLVYSIKNREEENSKIASMVSVKDDEINRLRQENEELKRTLAETKLQNSSFKASLDNITKKTREQETQKLKQSLKEAAIKGLKTGSPAAQLNKKSPVKTSYDKSQVNSLLAKFGSSTTADEKVEVLNALGEISPEQNSGVIKVAQDALGDPDSEVGVAAIELLDGYDSPEILPVVEKALKVEYEETRIAALEHLSDIDSPKVGDLLSQALNDTAKDVRTTALDMLDERPDSEQLPILQKGLTSPYEDVKTQVVQKLEDRSDHKGVEMLIEGLKDTNPDFRKEVNTSLSSLIDKEFKSYQEAKDWWNQNKRKYDAELSEIE
jgi:HEAT repeat protein